MLECQQIITYSRKYKGGEMNKPDILIVGAGIFGLTIAERMANELGKKVLVIDKRDHIGGNCYSEFDKETGIECHKYGAHLFHTSDEEVWKYVNSFTKFTGYVHKVYTTHNEEVFPMPINLGTINQFYHKALSPGEAEDLISEEAGKYADIEPKSLSEQGIKLIGQPLFDAFIKNYTAKQWQTPAEDLPASIITRLPVRYNYNNNYFANKYEGLPVDGYEKLFQNMIDSANGKIEVRLDTDYFDMRDEFDDITTIYTGAIDRFFNYSEGKLDWRSLELKKEIVNVDDFQGCPVMNYADLDPKYTRIHEFKHFHPERAYEKAKGKSAIVREYSKTWEEGDEPYYPVNTEENMDKLAKYRELAAKNPNVFFGGRLGEYAYYDMDKTFASALDLFNAISSKKRL